MKRILRHFIIDTYCLYLIINVAQGIKLENNLTTLILAGIAVTFVSLIAKPVINLLLLPINLITFGFFRWIASAIVLYLTTLIIPSFKILFFDFPGISSRWIDIPHIHLNGFLAYVGFSFLFSLIVSIIYWLIK
jgi:putative membrane protein